MLMVDGGWLALSEAEVWMVDGEIKILLRTHLPD